MCTEKIPHKHADVIKAWADGGKIQFRDSPRQNWVDWNLPTSPSWHPTFEYRIKFEPPKPIVRYGCADEHSERMIWYNTPTRWTNIKANFCPNTGALLSIEKI